MDGETDKKRGGREREKHNSLPPPQKKPSQTFYIPSFTQFLHACCPTGAACSSLMHDLLDGDVCESAWAVCSR